MQQAFQAAKARKVPALVLVIQVDPGFDLPETEELDESKDPGFSGYRNFTDKLALEAKQFNGQRWFAVCRCRSGWPAFRARP